MGKVGSTTVRDSLKHAQVNRPTYHVHSLSGETLQELEKSLAASFPHSLDNLRHIWRCQRARERVLLGLTRSDTLSPAERLQAITLVRDPIARNLSTFFQQVKAEPLASAGTPPTEWRLSSSFFDFDLVLRDNDTRALSELFFERGWHDFPPLWVDREIEGVLGIDVYATGFPRNQGYDIYHSQKADLLLIRLEDLNHCAARAFKEFLDLDQFSVVSANVGEQKGYASFYRALKSSIVFPKSYLDRIYSSQFAQHFYNEAERQEFKARWSKN
jgi:hypothetical protein